MTALRATSATIVPLPPNRPTYVRQRLDQGDKLSPVDKLLVYQHLNRVWRRHLDTQELSLMFYIVDRAVGYGADYFTAAVSNILTGTDRYAGLGLSRATFYRVVASLEAKGLLIKRAIGQRTRLVVNLTWMSDTADTSGTSPEKPQMLPVPKRLRGGGVSQRETGVSQRETGVSQRETQNTLLLKTCSKDGWSPAVAGNAPRVVPGQRENLSGEEGEWDLRVDKETGAGENALEPAQESDVHPVADFPEETPAGSSGNPVETLRERMTEIVVRQRTRPGTASTPAAPSPAAKAVETKLARIRQGRAMTSADIEAVWKLALVEAHPKAVHVNFSIKQQSRLKQEIKKWAFSKDGTILDFVDYAIRNWVQIVARKFKWMTKEAPPRYPELSFLLWRWGDFVEAWVSNEMSRFINDSDQDRLARLMAGGLTHDEAVKAMGREEAVTATREEMQRREQAAARKLREAKEREERAQNLEGFAEKHGASPLISPARPGLKGWAKEARVIDPRSETARALSQPPAQPPAPTQPMAPPPAPPPTLDLDMSKLVVPSLPDFASLQRARLAAMAKPRTQTDKDPA